MGGDFGFIGSFAYCYGSVAAAIVPVDGPLIVMYCEGKLVVAGAIHRYGRHIDSTGWFRTLEKLIIQRIIPGCSYFMMTIIIKMHTILSARLYIIRFRAIKHIVATTDDLILTVNNTL